MSCCNKLSDIIKKVISALKPILVVALLCVAAYFLILAPAGAVALFEGFTFLPAFVTSVSLKASTWGYLALGAAVMVDPAAVGEVAGNVAESVGQIAGTVISAAAGGVASSLFGGSSSWILAAAGAFLFYKFFLASDDDEKREAEAPSDKSTGDHKKREAKAPSDESTGDHNLETT